MPQLNYVSTLRPRGLTPEEETAFQQWYSRIAKQNNLNPNPDDINHFYDYRAAFLSGAMPDASGHWPSEFKAAGHPNQFIGGIDTVTGKAARGTPQNLSWRSVIGTSAIEDNMRRTSGGGESMRETLRPYTGETPATRTESWADKPALRFPASLEDAKDILRVAAFPFQSTPREMPQRMPQLDTSKWKTLPEILGPHGPSMPEDIPWVPPSMWPNFNLRTMSQAPTKTFQVDPAIAHAGLEAGAEFVTGLSTPRMGATVAASMIPGANAAAIPYFAYQMGKGAVQGGQQAYQSAMQGDIPGAVKAGTGALLSTGMAGTMAHRTPSALRSGRALMQQVPQVVERLAGRTPEYTGVIESLGPQTPRFVAPPQRAVGQQPTLIPILPPRTLGPMPTTSGPVTTGGPETSGEITTSGGLSPEPFKRRTVPEILADARLHQQQTPRVERIRGQIDVPINEAGRRQLETLSQEAQDAGGMDKAYAGTTSRMRQTARAMSSNVIVDPRLNDMDYGVFQGKPVASVIGEINKYIAQTPDVKLPGSSESFNDYKKRFISAIQDVQKEASSNPDKRIVAVVNRRSLKLLEASLAKGGVVSEDINPQIAMDYDPLTEPPLGHGWIIQKGQLVPLRNLADTPAGIPVFKRHVETSWNAPLTKPLEASLAPSVQVPETQIAAEVAPGIGRELDQRFGERFRSLPYETQHRITKTLLSEAFDTVRQGIREGTEVTRHFGVGGYQDAPDHTTVNPSGVLTLKAPEPIVAKYRESLRDILDQDEVMSFTPTDSPTPTSDQLLAVRSKSFANRDNLMSFWRELQKQSPEVGGFAPAKDGFVSLSYGSTWDFDKLERALQVTKAATGLQDATWDFGYADRQSTRRETPNVQTEGIVARDAGTTRDHPHRYRGTHEARFEELLQQAEAKKESQRGSIKFGPTYAVEEPLVAAYRDLRDYTTIDPIPKLTRAGIQDEAIAHTASRIAVPRMIHDMLAQVFPEEYRNPFAMHKTMRTIVLDNILGGYDDLLQRTAEAREAGDTDAVKYLKKITAYIEKRHDLAAYENEVREAAEDPKVAANIHRWKQIVNPVLDQLFNEVKGQDPEMEREGRGRVFGARVNLIAKTHEPDWLQSLTDESKEIPQEPQASASSYRNPNAKYDRFDRMAKYSAKEYSDDPVAMLASVLYRRYNEATKLRFYKKLLATGYASEEPPENGLLKGEPAVYAPVKMPQTGPTGTWITERPMWIAKPLQTEFRSVLGVDAPLKMSSVASFLTKAQILQFADATAHIKNIHSVIANAQGTKSLWTDVVKKMPGIASADAFARIAHTAYEVHQDTPAMRQELDFMARNGMLRQHYPATGIQRITKMQDLILGVDTASRVVMNRFYTNLVNRGMAQDSMTDRRDFVNQIGQYNRRLMGPYMQRAAQSGLSPFIVAGRNFNRFSRRLLFGTPGFRTTSASTEVKARMTNLASLVTVVTLPAILNTITTGSMGGRPGTPIGAIDLGGEEDRAKGTHKVFDLLQLMGVRRGLRGSGMGAVLEGIHNRSSFDDIIGNGISDVVSTAAHPWLGPAPGFLLTAATGERLDLRGGPSPPIAQRMEGKGSQYLEYLRVAAKGNNALLYSPLRPLFDDVDETPARDFLRDVLRSPQGAIGITGVTSPALQKARSYAYATPLTPKQKQRQRERAKLEETMVTESPGSTRELARQGLKERVITGRDITRALEGSQLTALQRAVMPRTLEQVFAVWEQASPAERAQLRPILLRKIDGLGKNLQNATADQIAILPQVRQALSIR